MNAKPDILCIGSVLWDIIGRSASHMRVGSDVPGRITRLPGGVAMNIAQTVTRFGLRPALLTTVGRDPEGEELLDICTRMGMETAFVHRSDELPTDRYMAVEGANGVIAAIADAHSLEAAGARILEPLLDGRLGSAERPWDGLVALDGNLTVALLEEIAASAAFAAADIRVAPASPGKAERLIPLLPLANATIYVNLEEASIIAHDRFDGAEAAARALVAQGARRVLVTDGGRPAALATADGTVLSACPPEVMVTRVTGAGDTFMAAHIAAERAGDSPDRALDRALQVAAAHVSGDVPL